MKSESINSAQPQPQTGKETTTDSTRMTLKIMVQKSDNKVLFAQAEENFVEFLFSLLDVPLGSVMSLLGGNTSAGSIENLYKSVSVLDIGRYIKSQELKEMLLNPQLPLLHFCKNQIFPLCEAQYYLYGVMQTSGLNAAHLTLQKQKTQVTMNAKITQELIRGPAMYMVTDDLLVTPLSSMSSISFLKRFKIPLRDVQERVISIGMEEVN